MGLKTIQSNSFGKISRVIFEFIVCTKSEKKREEKERDTIRPHRPL